MPTILDELVVKLGIDGTSFSDQAAKTQVALGKTGAVARRESRALEENLVKTQDATIKRLQQVEQVGRQASQQFRTMSSHVLGLLGTLAGAYSLTQFVRGIVTTDAAVGRLSKMLGISTEELSTWQGAAELAGGAAEDINQSFMTLSQEFQRLQATGRSPITQFFEAMRVPLFDAKNQLRPFRDLMLDLADFASKHSGPESTFFLSQIGLTPGAIQLLIKGREEVTRFLAASEKRGVTRQQDADAAIALEQSLVGIRRAVQRLGATITTEFAPSLVQAIQGMEDWVVQNREWLRADIVERIGQAIDIMKKFAAGVQEVVDYLGGWKQAAEIILAVWAASKVAPLLSFLATFTGMVITATTAVTGLGASLTAIAVPAWFTKLLTLLPALSALLLTGPAGGEDPEFSRRKNEEYLRDHPPGSPQRSFMDWLFNRPGKNTFSPTADTGMAPERRAFLDALSRGESGGDYGAKNPGSTAHGRYQFINSTDAEVSAATGLPGQDPVSQDRKAWFLAERTYRQNVGRDLGADLKEGGHEAQIAYALRSVWPSLPGGSQQNTSMVGWLTNMRNATASYQQPPVTGVLPQVAGPPSVDPGLGVATRPSPAGTDNSRTSSVETNVNGPINIHTSATDADGIARGIGGALQKYSYVPQVNAGLA